MSESEKTIAGVVVEKTIYSFDMIFDYIVPDNMQVTAGQRVIVPFGRGNEKRVGLIMNIRREIPEKRLKEIYSAVEDGVVLDTELTGLIEWLKENTFCTYFDAVKTILPGGLAINISENYQISPEYKKFPDSFSLTTKESITLKMLLGCKGEKELNQVIAYGGEIAPAGVIKSLCEKGVLLSDSSIKQRTGYDTEKSAVLTEYYLSGEFEKKTDKPLTPKQKKAVDFLSECGSASVKEICYNCLVTKAVIDNLVKQGVAEYFSNIVLRSPTADMVAVKRVSDIVLNDQQENAFRGISALMDKAFPECALLKGITGSGKTTVFVKLIQKALDQGKTAMMLVPEISLTPQMLSYFTDYFGGRVAVIHSNLSLGQRMDEYKRIKEGNADVVIGTRSAVFSPLKNIGVIIIDEEGEHTYKSEMSPRYHARNVAKQRAFYNKCTLVLASATPSIDSAYRASIGKYHLFELTKRYSRAILPKVKIVDMKIQALTGNRSNFSDILIEELRANLDKGEQSILLINRRGFNTFLSCLKCGTAATCPNCNIALTYHKKNNSLTCHYCGYQEEFSGVCKECGSKFIHTSGTGTQRIEEELAAILPTAKILRMDADTTMTKDSYEKGFTAFKNKEYDILVGTQMIAKGLDFENVTLVGVLMIDKSLYAGDYLGYENTFSLVTQVVGRCGRGTKEGRAYLQTFSPDHYVLNLAALQDYDEFFRQECEIRKTLLFPPYCDICVVGFSSTDENACIKGSKAFVRLFSENLINADIPIRLLGPTPANMAKLNGKYRYRVIIKCKNGKKFRAVMSKTLRDAYNSEAPKNVSFYADMNGEIT